MTPRLHFLPALAALFLCPAIVVAQDTAAGIAAREEYETNYRRVNAKIEQLEETLQAQQKKLSSLVAEIHAMRDRADTTEKRNEITAIKESVKTLASKIEEVDRKRVADNKLILERLDAIRKAVTGAPGAPGSNSKEPDKGAPSGVSTTSKKTDSTKVKKADTAKR